MTLIVLLNCPIKAEIRAVDKQSDLRLVIAELLARAKRARGRSPIAKVIYPSKKIW